MRVDSVEILGRNFIAGDKVVVIERADNDRFFVSEDHFDCFNRPIKYTINWINKKITGSIEIALKIEGHNARNPKTPHKTITTLPISDYVAITKADYEPPLLGVYFR